MNKLQKESLEMSKTSYISQKGDRITLVRKAKPEHKLLKPVGWAWNIELIEEYKRQGVTDLIVIAPWENRRYSATFDLFLQKAFKIDRGYGDQLVLPEKYWNVEPIDPNKEVERTCQKKSKHTPTLF